MRSVLASMCKEVPILYRLVCVPCMKIWMALGFNNEWKERIARTIACPDNARLRRVADAGFSKDGTQVMHNGLRIYAGSYYGYVMARLLEENSGVHEPQEELVFSTILPAVENGSTMMELGSYWAFYSMWFAQEVQDSRCICVEPAQQNLRMGERNFLLNGLKAVFLRGYVGAHEATAPDGVPVVTVDATCRRQGVEKLAILHMDVQGAELDGLRGATEMLSDDRIDYVFVSTHSNELHVESRDLLQQFGHRVIADANCDQSYSQDGILVTCRAGIDQPVIQISHRSGVGTTAGQRFGPSRPSGDQQRGI